MLKSTILVFCLCAVPLLAKSAVDESTAKKFIIESSDKFSELYSEIAKTIFELSDFVTDDSSEEQTKADSKENEVSASTNEEWTSGEITGFFAFFLVLAELGKVKEATENITTLADETYKFPIDQFTDEEIKIGILKLRTMPGLLALGDAYHKWSENDFDDFLKNKNFCKFKEEQTECKAKYCDLFIVLKNGNDPDEALYYWKEWRERNLEESTKKLKSFIELYEKLGEKFQKSAKFAWFAEFLDENLGDEMEKVVNDLQPLYKDLHAYVRYVLHEQYGEKVPATGLIPHHLYEQAMAQAWKPDSVVAKEFKDVNRDINNELKKTAKEILNTASDFMKSLGLSELPENFWNTHVKEHENKCYDCISEIYDRGNSTYFKYCNEVTVRRFFQMYEYIGRVYYANERKNLPFAYTDAYNLEFATGEAVMLSARTPKYLHAIGLLKVDVLQEDQDMNRLFRMGIHTLLTVPEYFVHVKVIADVLDKTVPFGEINKHYWDLMKKYLGVAPPVERNAEAIDFPQRFYNKIENNHQAVKFVSEIVGFQMYEAFCEKSGDFVKGDKTLLLHNCNLYNSKEAGKSLKHMMQLGSRKPWQQLLGTVTGDDSGMKADAILQYFKPLQKWLQLKNTEHGVTAGWKTEN